MTSSLQKQSRLKSLTWFPLFLCCILCWHCDEQGVAVQVDKDNFTVDNQIAIGQVLKDQILSMPEHYPVLDKVEHQCAYKRIEVLYETLLNTSIIKNRKVFNWDVTIIDDSNNRNVFTLPGGHLFIYSGLVKYLQSESELMAVLGHEIAYADKELMLNAIIETHGNITISSLCSNNTTADLPTIAESLPSLHYDEATVLEADELSISLTCFFRYDIESLRRVVEKAERKQIEWIQSKGGDVAKRIDHIKQFSNGCGLDEPTYEERYFNYKNKCF